MGFVCVRPSNWRKVGSWELARRAVRWASVIPSAFSCLARCGLLMSTPGEGLGEDEDISWARGHGGGDINSWSAGLSNSASNACHVVLHPSAILKHGHIASIFNGHVFHGDVVGIRVDVGHGRVAFYINGVKKKEMQIRVPSCAWVPWVCSCTTRVQFTLVSKDELGKEWAPVVTECENALAHGAVQNGLDVRKKQEARLVELLLKGEGRDEVLELIIAGVELPTGWFRGLELDEVSVAADTVKLLLSSQSPIAPGALKQPGSVGSGHIVVQADISAHDKLSSSKEFLRDAERIVAQRRREVEQTSSMLQGLASGEDAYEEQAAMDLSLTLGNQAEHRRLAGLLSEAQQRLSDARRERDERAKTHAVAAAAAAQTAAMVAGLHERSVNLLYSMYVPIVRHLSDNTTAAPTFSAPNAQAATDARLRRQRGIAVSDNELVPVKIDDATGSMTVTVQSASPSARIFYSIDGSTPNENTSPSVASGRKIVLSGSTHLLAFAAAPNMRPSAVISSLPFVVACSPPVFVAPSVGGEKIKVQLRSGTTGQVKIHYAFNSRDATPIEFALEGGNPIKEAPYGDGRGRRDGSKPLRNESTGEPTPNAHCAGVTNNFEFVEVVTSGHLLAFASKHGMADSAVVQSNMFTIAGK